MYVSFGYVPQGSSRMNQKVTTESQSITNQSENLSHGEPSHILNEGKFDRVQKVIYWVWMLSMFEQTLFILLFYHSNT